MVGFYKKNKEQILTWSKILYQFSIGQGLLQASNLIIGVLILRWLSKEQYAQYSMAYAFQTTAQMFVEFGFSSAVVALVGKQINEKEVVGKYIAAGRSYRSKTYLLISAICCFVFPYLAYKQNWTTPTIFLLLLSIVSNLYFSGWVTYYKPVMQIQKRISSIYKLEVSSSILRGIILLIINAISGMYSWVASLIASLMIAFNGSFYKKLAKPYVIEPDAPPAEAKKEMLNFITPIIPGILFSAFQSQITIFIISIFGKSSSIAEVGALGRLGQLFTFLNIATSIIIVPIIARQSNRELLKKYIIIVTASVLFVTVLTACGYAFPNYFLLILGDKYTNLNREVSLVVLNSSLFFLNGLLWGMNSSRKWLFKWMPLISIPGSILISIFGVFFLDLSKTYNVILLANYDAVFILLTRINVSVWGFRKYVYGKS